jgi:recA bacterial DNA recombination protein
MPTPKKPAIAKQPKTKQPKSPKTETKKGRKPPTEIRLEDPDKFQPLVFKPKVEAAGREKVLGKMTVHIRQSIEILNERSQQRPIRLFTPAMLRRNVIPYEELPFQHMLGSIGFRYPCAIEVVAQEGVGSTTFVFDWISRLLDVGCYPIYCECEGKQMSDKRIKRIMDRDPKMAVSKVNAIEFTEARSLAQFDATLRQTVKDLRKRCDSEPETKGNPIFFFADPWGALMSKGEAKGNTEWGLSSTAKKEAPKETADGSNFEHAKHAQAMARWLPAFMEENNCTVIFLNKQNDKIDMNAKPTPGYLAPSPLKNDTRVGGRALKRLCAYRMTMMSLSDIRAKDGGKEVYGHHLRMMMVKNSYGPRTRTCDSTLFFDRHKDEEGYQAPAFTYADRTASWMVAHKFLGTTVEKDLYTCDTLGCIAVQPEELMVTLREHPEHVAFLGGQLDIEGYAREVRHIVPAAVDQSDEADEDDEPASDADADEPAPGVVP